MMGPKPVTTFMVSIPGMFVLLECLQEASYLFRGRGAQNFLSLALCHSLGEFWTLQTLSC